MNKRRMNTKQKARGGLPLAGGAHWQTLRLYWSLFVSSRGWSAFSRLAQCLALALLVGFCGCSPSTWKEDRLKKADALFQAGKREEAMVEYMAALRMDFNNALAVNRIGQICVERGELRRAYPFLEKAKEIDPSNIKARLILARHHLANRKIKESREEVLAVLRIDPVNEDAVLALADSALSKEDIESSRRQLRAFRDQGGDKAFLHVALGYLFFREQKTDEAEREFKQALSMDPQCGPAHVALATVFWQRNSLEEADASFALGARHSKDKPPVLLRHADFQTKIGRAAAAKRILADLAEIVPDYLPAWQMSAEIAYGEKRYDESMALVKRILERDGLSYDAQLLRASLVLAGGDTQSAIDILASMGSQYPGSAMVQYRLAQALATKGELLQTMACLEKAVSIDPLFVDAILRLSELQVLRGDVIGAVTALNKFIEDRPNIPQAYLVLANAHRSRGTYDEALAVYARFMEKFPKDPQGPFFAGVVHRLRGDAAKARQFFEKAQTMAPENLLVVNQLVELDLAEKSFPAAVARASRMVEGDPKSLPSRLLLAKTYLAQNDFAKAEQALLLAIEADPTSGQAYSLLARLYVSSNKAPQATERLRESVTRNPKAVESWMQMAVIADSSGNADQAAYAYGKVLAINPDFQLALNNLAYIHIGRGEIDKAFPLAKRARDLRPSDPYSADTLGWVLFRQGQYAKALALLKEAADQLPAEPEVLFHFGMAQYMVVDEEASIRSFRQAIQSGAKFAGREEAERRLAILELDPAKADRAAVALLEQASAQRPDDPVVQIRLGALAERSGDAAKAMGYYERIIKANPIALPALRRLAQICSLRPADQELAVDYAKRVRALAPRDPVAAEILGRIAYRKRDFKWALSLLQESVQARPGEPEVFRELALSYYGVGQVPQALEAMSSALKAPAGLSDPAGAKLFAELVGLWLAPGDPAQELGKVGDALRADPDFVPALMLSARAKEAAGDSVGARQIHEKVLARYPFFAPALLRLSVYYGEKDDKKALDLVAKARELLPFDPEVAKALGVANYRVGEFGAAVVFLSEGAARLNKDPDLFYHLGMAHYRLRHSQEAKSNLKKSVELGLAGKLRASADRILAEMN